MRRAAAAATSAALLASCSASHTGASSRSAPRPGLGSPSTAPPAKSSAPVTSVPAGNDEQWTTYQNGNARLGVAGSQPVLTPLRPVWSESLDGAAVYGQPLAAAGRVIVATEADDVYALDPHDGRTIWQVNVGTPLRNVAQQAGCGNVDPLGVTSTPVIDPATGIVYVLAETSDGGRAPVHHELVGLDVATGHQVSSMDADPPLPAGEDPLQLLQRASLALSGGRVYIGYGGHFGDCGTYHGWVVAVAEDGSAKAAFDVTPQSTGRAVWQGGAAPSIDPAGDVYVSTGNPNSAGSAPWAEAVLKLAGALGPAPEASFEDQSASGDLDLSAGSPVLLPDGAAFVVGKTEIGYLLRQSDLSLIATIRGRVCGSDPDGGAAYDAVTASVYVPCRGGGIQQVNLATRSTGWREGTANSTPVLAGGGLWALRYPAGTLEELDPATGGVLSSFDAGRPVPNFASPAVVGGLILVPTQSGIVAFGSGQ
ncbi:MAG: PQQ-binding-like beta-propeller repeat protein [Acidimicrobiales bacterium]|nr:PQQ-binding-like beta-propeller repeat protein [Acidimicrobiales bacterium]